MGPSLNLALREQHLDPSGIELLANNLFTASQWVGAGYAWDPTGWTVTSPDTAANHIEPGPGGSGIRIVSDGTWVSVNETVVQIGHTYQYMVVVSAITGNLVLASNAVNAVVMGAPGTYSGTFVPDSTNVTLKRGGACDATVTFLSIQEVIQVTVDSSDFCDAVAYLASGRGGAQESISIVKLENVNRTTGAVTTVADFSASPGAGAVYTLPTGWSYVCSSGSRTTQTSGSTLVTGIAANAAPAKSQDGAAFALSVECSRTNYVSNQVSGWGLSGGCLRAAATDPAGGLAASRLTDSDGAQLGLASLGGIGCSGVGNPHIASCWVGSVSTSTPGSVALYASNNIPANVSVAPPTVGWSRYASASGNATVATSTHSAIPAYFQASYQGVADFYAPQFEQGKYPSSSILTAGAAVTRAAATLSCPLDVCNTHSALIPQATYRPDFAYNETLYDAIFLDDSRGVVYFEQSTQKFVFEVRGRGRIASLACTFSRYQAITLRADINEATGLLTLYVAGCTTGNGTYQTYVSSQRKVVCGDGYTAASFPTQLSPSNANVPHGASFDGGDYFDCGKMQGDYLSEFTLFVVVAGWSQRLITKRLGTATQYDWYINPATGTQNLYNGSLTITGTADLRLGVHTIAVTFEATGGGTLRQYVDGRQENFSGGMPLAQSVARTFVGATDGPANYGTGKMLRATIFPFVVGPQQMQILHAAAMKEYSTP